MLYLYTIILQLNEKYIDMDFILIKEKKTLLLGFFYFLKSSFLNCFWVNYFIREFLSLLCLSDLFLSCLLITPSGAAHHHENLYLPKNEWESIIHEYYSTLIDNCAIWEWGFTEETWLEKNQKRYKT